MIKFTYCYHHSAHKTSFEHKQRKGQYRIYNKTSDQITIKNMIQNSKGNEWGWGLKQNSALSWPKQNPKKEKNATINLTNEDGRGRVKHKVVLSILAVYV